MLDCRIPTNDCNYSNFAEALGQELQREEQKSFAAVCYLESAKCQESLRNNVQQANSLVKAAKLFLEAWESEQHFNFNGEPFSDQSDTTCLFGNLEVRTSDDIITRI